jgi:hypothetical protein
MSKVAFVKDIRILFKYVNVINQGVIDNDDRERIRSALVLNYSELLQCQLCLLYFE